jgi:tRNA(Arg) A34 adenosine deaminase TadA
MSGEENDDRTHMREALELARLSVEDGAGGPFGALVVRDGYILGRGRNRVIADCDPTAHAELLAIREACAAVGDFHLSGATLYTTCEPCPMCRAAAYWAHLDRVVFAAATADAAAIGFDDGRIRQALAGGGAAMKLAAGQLMREDALEDFRLWEGSPLRRGY